MEIGGIVVNPSVDKVVYLKPKQEKFVLSKSRFPAFVSSWATGKSLSGISRAMKLSQDYPDNLGVVFRREYEDLRDSTCKDFEYYTGIEIDSGRDARVGTSTIMFRHMEEMNNLQNMNLGWFWIEQAEELDTDDQFFTLFGRLRRANVPMRTGFITANTKGHNWIYRLWKQGELEATVKKLGFPIDGQKISELIEMQTHENEDILTADFLQSLEILKIQKPKLYNRFVLNSWDDEDVIDQILLPEWIDAAIDRQAVAMLAKSVVVCDPARYGDDETVIYAMRGYRIIDQAIYNQKSTMETAGHIVEMASKHGIISVAVDSIGIGAGIVDRLREMGKDVIGVNSASKPNHERYRNLRAEMWSTAADKFYNNHVSVINDPKLIEQLKCPKYKTIESNGTLQVESKDEIKKRLGCSPDRADCYIMGLWAVERAKLTGSMASGRRNNWQTKERAYN